MDGIDCRKTHGIIHIVGAGPRACPFTCTCQPVHPCLADRKRANAICATATWSNMVLATSKRATTGGCPYGIIVA